MYDPTYDTRIKCWSIMTSMKVGDYLDLVANVYGASGGLEGQRTALKTKTALSIRKRMVDDLLQGAVIPPVVVGVNLVEGAITGVERLNDAAALVRHIGRDIDERISIIDGMQRTTAMIVASQSQPEFRNTKVRVEFWISAYLGSLIYRMLILNTGQIPWELGRQLETVYGQFLRIIREKIGSDVEIFLKNDNRRRYAAGQYQSSNVVELFLLFSSRKSELDIRDRVAEDFARLDAVETSSHHEFLDYYIETLALMSRLDAGFSKARDKSPDRKRFDEGKDIFAAFPAMVGFFTAAAVHLFDEPGFPIAWESVPGRLEQLKTAINTVAAKLEAMDSAQASAFLDLDLLEQRLSVRSGQVGRFEREFFRKSFASLIRNAERLDSMTPCWMA